MWNMEALQLSSAQRRQFKQRGGALIGRVLRHVTWPNKWFTCVGLAEPIDIPPVDKYCHIFTLVVVASTAVVKDMCSTII